MPALIMRLCLLRAGPEDLPYSPPLLLASFAAQIGVNAIVLKDQVETVTALFAASAYTFTLVALVHATLLFRGRGPRAAQTIAAVNFADALIGIFGWVAASLLGSLLPSGLAQLPFVIWFIAVFGHILRRALDLGVSLTLGLAILYFLSAGAITGALVALPPVTTGGN